MKKKTNYWSKISIENLPIKKYLILTMLALLFPLVSFSQTVYTFTSAGATGRFGPTQSEVTTAYTATTLAGAVTVNTQGYQEWVVPVTGNYSIQAIGASGGQQSTYEFGTGANIYGEFALTAGTVLKIVVGQYGLNGNGWEGSGGGGGSFVVLLTGNSPLLVAAGGAGSDGNGNYNARLHPGGTSIFGNPAIQATTTPNGSEAGSAGGGFNLNGEDGYVSTGGQSFLNGAIGGDCRYGELVSHGGFGGGGAGDWYTSGGAGGGYQGGNTVSSYGVSTGPQAAYSYNSGTNQINNSGIDGATDPALKNNGQVIMTYLYSASISQTANVVCSGDLTGALSVAVNGGTGPYAYAWSPNVSSTSTASGLAKGAYSVTVTDGNSLTTTASFTIVPTDKTAPVITTNGDKNVNTSPGVCGATVIVSATATDNCTVGTPVGVRSDAKLLTDLYPVGTTTITWNVSDANGNAAVAVIQTITVTDNQIPVIIANGNKTVNVDANSCGANVTVSASATDNCTVGTPSGVRSDAKLLSDVYPLGITTIKWNVSDANGNAAVEVTQTVTVTDNQKPVIVSNGDQNVNVDGNTCGANVTVSASATDNCTVGTPSGVRSDAKLLSDVYPVGITTIKWNVSDASGNAAVEVTQTVTVTDNQIPVIASNGDQNVNTDSGVCGANVTVSASATDNCTVGTPSGIRSDAQLLTDVYPLGTTKITWNVSDANGNAAVAVIQTITVIDNEIPVIASNGDQNVNVDGNTCGANVTVSASATDNCTVGTPSGVRSDAKLLSDVYPLGITTIKWNVSDANGNAAVEVTQTVTVTDNQKPVIASNGDLNVNVDGNTCEATVTVSASATDNCTVGIPSGVRSDSKLLSDVYPVGITTIKWNVSDANGNAAVEVTQTVTVTDNQKPVIVSNGDQNVNVDANTCGANVTVSASATDNCTVGTPSGVRSDAKLLTDLYPVGTTTIKWNVSDANGNAAVEVTQTVTVTDNVLPTVITKDIIVQLDASGNAAITASDVDNNSFDDCGIATLTVSPNTFTCVNIGNNNVTLTATDANGNVSSATAKVTIEDKIAPIVVTKDIIVQLDATGNASILASEVDNGSTDSCGTPTLTVSPNTFTCVNIGNNNVTLTATDANGNVSSATAKVTIEDKIAPIVVTKDIIVQLDATGNASILASEVDNSSTDSCGTPTLTVSPDTFTCANVGNNTVILTATDANGNVSSATAIVKIEDKTPATVVTKDIIVQLDATGNASILASEVDNGSTDYCGTPTLTVSPDTFTCANVGNNTVTLTATDAKGNVSSATAIVKIEDKTPATVVTKDIIVQLDATGNASILASNVDNGSTDSCGTPVLTVSPNTFTCANIGNNTVTLTATDASGNVSSKTAIVTIENKNAPIALAKNSIVQLNATGNATITAADVNNGSITTCGTPALTISPSTFTCANVGANTVTLTVTDANGNVSSATAIVTVQDKIAPVVLVKNAPVQLDASGNVAITANQIDNGSSDTCGIASITVTPSTFTCATVGANQVTLKVTDVNGNVATATATVMVEDLILPTAKTRNLSVKLDDAGNASITVNEVNNGSSDNCGIASVSVSKLSFDCTNVGANNVVLTVTDKNGNKATATAIVTVTNTFGDNDNDGILDNCDADDDNDGIADAVDNCPITANPYQEDRNHNGLGDACDKDQMNISEAFTPNGDGINDTWVISNIENYPASVVRVFNRWGAEVFVARNYQNDWDGQSKGNSSTLPAASSYYYQIDLDGNGSIDKQGWIYINR